LPGRLEKESDTFDRQPLGIAGMALGTNSIDRMADEGRPT